MDVFKNFRIRTKLLLAFSFVALITVAVGYTGITKIRQVDRADTELYESMTVPLAQLAGITEAVQRIRVALRACDLDAERGGAGDGSAVHRLL